MDTSNLSFLIDTVALFQLSTSELGSKLVQHQGVVVEEISYECRYDPGGQEISALLVEVDAGLLRKMAEVLRQPVVQKVIDLYDYKGNGDVVLLAKALLEREHGEMQLLPKEWVIVTDDKGLIRAATANEVTTYSSTDFKNLLSKSALATASS